MAPKNVYTVQFDLQGKATGLLNAIKQAQGAFNKMKIEPKIKESLIKQLSGMEGEINKIINKIDLGITNQNDITNIDKSITSLFKNYEKFDNTLQRMGIDPEQWMPKSVIANFEKADAAYQDILSAQQEQIKNNKIIQESETKLAQAKVKSAKLEEEKKAVEASEDKPYRTKSPGKIREQIDTAQSKLAKNGTSSDITSQINQLKSTGSAIPEELQKSLVVAQQLEAKIVQLQAELNKPTYSQWDSEFKNTQVEVEKLTQDITNAQNAYNTGAADIATKTDALKQSLISLGIPQEEISDNYEEMIQQAQRFVVEVSKTNNSAAGQALDNLGTSLNTLEDAFDANRGPAQEFSRSIQDLENIRSRVNDIFSFTGALRVLEKVVRSAFSTVKELDAAMTETAVVTENTVADMWNQLDQYTAKANELGATTKGAYETMTLYYQQGLKDQEAWDLGVETMKMARIANMDYTTATDAMTAAVRGFNMELNAVSGQRINDVYSELAAKTASNTKEISTAMEKVASLASNAGMDLETTAVYLSQAIETTREAPENIGTAMKTILARFQSLTKDPDTLSVDVQEALEGETVDANNVEAALRKAGVALRDEAGEFRDAKDVLLELNAVWDTLDKNTQRYIATQTAGSRQQSRFIAMMQDYARTQELIGYAQNSAGASQKQFEKTQESLEAKLNKLSNAWNEFTMGIADNRLIKAGVDILTDLLTVINKLTGSFGPFVSIITKGALAFAGWKTIPRILDKVLVAMQSMRGIDTNKMVRIDLSKFSLSGIANFAGEISSTLQMALNKAKITDWRKILSLDNFKTKIGDISKSFSESFLKGRQTNILDTIANATKADGITKLDFKDENTSATIGEYIKNISLYNKAKKDALNASKEGNTEDAELFNQLAESYKATAIQAIDTAVELGVFNGILGEEQIKALKAAVANGSLAGMIEAVGITSTTAAGEVLLFGMSLKTALPIIGAIVTAIGLIVAAFKIHEKQVETACENAEASIEKYNKTASSVKENLSSIGDVKDEFTKLSKGVDDAGNNIGLSANEFERYHEIVNQLVEISPSIVQGYDNEGNAIINKTTAISDLIDIENEELETAQRQYTSNSNLADIITDVTEKNKELAKSYETGNLAKLSAQQIAEKDKTYQEDRLELLNQLEIKEQELADANGNTFLEKSIQKDINSINDEISSLDELHSTAQEISQNYSEITDVLNTYTSTLDGASYLQNNFGNILSGSIEDIAKSGKSATEMKNDVRDLINTLTSSEAESGLKAYKEGLREIEQAKEDLDNSARDTSDIEKYNDTVDSVYNNLIANADNFSDATRTAMLEAAESIKSYASAAEQSLTDALNPFQNAMLAAESLSDVLDEVEEHDYYAIADGMSEVLETALDTKNTGGKGSKSFWATSLSYLNESFLESINYNEQAAEKKLKQIQQMTQEGLAGAQAFENYYQSKLKGKTYDNGKSMLNADNGLYFDTSNIDELAKALDLSTEATEALINKYSQFVDIDWSNNPEQMINAAINDGLTIAADSAKKAGIWLDDLAMAANEAGVDIANTSKNWKDAGGILLKTSDSGARLAGKLLKISDEFNAGNGVINGDKLITSMVLQGKTETEIANAVAKIQSEYDKGIQLSDDVDSLIDSAQIAQAIEADPTANVIKDGVITRLDRMLALMGSGEGVGKSQMVADATSLNTLASSSKISNSTINDNTYNSLSQIKTNAQEVVNFYDNLKKETGKLTKEQTEARKIANNNLKQSDKALQLIENKKNLSDTTVSSELNEINKYNAKNQEILDKINTGNQKTKDSIEKPTLDATENIENSVAPEATVNVESIGGKNTSSTTTSTPIVEDEEDNEPEGNNPKGSGLFGNNGTKEEFNKDNTKIPNISINPNTETIKIGSTQGAEKVGKHWAQVTQQTKNYSQEQADINLKQRKNASTRFNKWWNRNLNNQYLGGAVNPKDMVESPKPRDLSSQYLKGAVSPSDMLKDRKTIQPKKTSIFDIFKSNKKGSKEYQKVYDEIIAKSEKLTLSEENRAKATELADQAAIGDNKKAAKSFEDLYNNAKSENVAQIYEELPEEVKTEIRAEFPQMTLLDTYADEIEKLPEDKQTEVKAAIVEENFDPEKSPWKELLAGDEFSSTLAMTLTQTGDMTVQGLKEGWINFNPEDKTLVVDTTAPAAQASIENLQKTWDNLKEKTKTLKVKIQKTGANSITFSSDKTSGTLMTFATKAKGQNLGSMAFGSAATGANASNDTKAKRGKLGPKGKGGLTLTGELGPELVWEPTAGISYMTGSNGPEMRNLPGNAVVWPADQTKRIMKSAAKGQNVFGSAAKTSTTGGSTIANNSTLVTRAAKTVEKTSKGVQKLINKLFDAWYNNAENYERYINRANKYQQQLDNLLNDWSADSSKIGDLYDKIISSYNDAAKFATNAATQVKSKIKELNTGKLADEEGNFIGKKKNKKGKTVSGTVKKKSKAYDNSKYGSIEFDDVTGEAYVVLTETAMNLKDKDTKIAKAVQNYINKLEETKDAYNEYLKDAEDANQGIIDIVNELRDQASSFINDLTDVLQYAQDQQYETQLDALDAQTRELDAQQQELDKRTRNEITNPEHQIDIDERAITLQERQLELQQRSLDKESRALEKQQRGLDQQERQINDLETINNTIDDGNKQLVETIQKNISKIRQDRSNKQTEDDLASKRAQLELLKRDTSGANQNAILQLQKEIADATQDYEDTLVDQKLAAMEDSIDQAGKQRQQQIDIMQNQLDVQKRGIELQEQALEEKQWAIDDQQDLIDDAKNVIDDRRFALEQAQWELDDLQFAIDEAQEIIDWQKSTIEREQTANPTVTANDTLNWMLENTDTNGNLTKEAEQTLYQQLLTKNNGNWMTADNELAELKSGLVQFNIILQKGNHDTQKTIANGDKQQLVLAQAQLTQSINSSQLDEKTKADILAKIQNLSTKDLSNLQSTVNNILQEAGLSAEESNAIIGLADNLTKAFSGAIGEYIAKIDKTATVIINGEQATYNEKTGKYETGSGASYDPNALGDQNLSVLPGSGTNDTPSTSTQTESSSLKPSEIIAQKGSITPESDKSDIIAAKKALEALEYAKDGKNGFHINGSWGDGMEAAVEAFKKANGNSNTNYRLLGSTAGRDFAKHNYKTGGLADYTGPAWLDGTPTKPEIVLNATDSANLMDLRDILRAGTLQDINTVTNNTQSGDTTVNIQIDVEQMASDYDAQKLAKQIKQEIIQKSNYRNVNTLSRRR